MRRTWGKKINATRVQSFPHSYAIAPRVLGSRAGIDRNQEKQTHSREKGARTHNTTVHYSPVDLPQEADAACMMNICTETAAGRRSRNVSKNNTHFSYASILYTQPCGTATGSTGIGAGGIRSLCILVAKTCRTVVSAGEPDCARV